MNASGNLRRALEEVRAMIAQLERSNPSVTVLITKANAERLVTLLDASVLCHVTEAMVVAVFQQDYSAAAAAMTRAAHSMPENASVYASLAGYCMLAGDLDAARAAIQRALLLNSNSIEIAKLARAIEHKGLPEPTPNSP
jgi:predicted Zn-dependent protease